MLSSVYILSSTFAVLIDCAALGVTKKHDDDDDDDRLIMQHCAIISLVRLGCDSS